MLILPRSTNISKKHRLQLSFDARQVNRPRLGQLTRAATLIVIGIAGAAGLIAQPQVKLLSGTAERSPAPTELGRAIAIDGDTVVVGSPSFGSRAGVVHVYNLRNSAQQTGRVRGRRAPSGTPRVASVSALDAAANANFGYSVAVSGNRMVIGAIGADESGKVYIFQQDPNDPNSVWTQTSTLSPATALAGMGFGASVSFAGDIVVVGAPGSPGTASAGEVYVFESNGNANVEWTQSAVLTIADGAAGDQFGLAVAIDGSDIVVGAAGSDALGLDSGIAYTFSRTAGGGTWVQATTLRAADPSPGANFGVSVAISGNTVVVGASGDSAIASSAGAAYVFERTDQAFADWSQISKLAPEDGRAGDLFGFRGAIAITGGMIAVGSIGSDAGGLDAGAVYLFRQDGVSGTWSLRDKLTASDSAPSGHYGYSLAISGGDIAVTALNDGPNSKDAGLGYVAFGTTAQIDIDPGAFPNAINPLRSNGVVAVAVFTTSIVDGDSVDFDATTIDIAQTTFGQTGLELNFEKHGTLHLSDIDGDGDTDAVLHFATKHPSSGILCSDTIAVIQGKTLGGADFMGIDSIKTVGQCAKKSDLLTAKVLASGDFTAGSMTPSVYQITVENLGPATAKSVSVNDPVPAGITVAAAPTTTLGSCGGVAGDTSFSCNLGDLPVGTTVTITASVLLGSSASGSKTNTAGVTSNTDPNSPQMPSVTNLVEIKADLSLTKGVDQANAAPGESLVYTIVINNAGPSDAVGATIVDTAPMELSNFTLDSCTPTGGAICPVGGAITGAVDIPAGGSLTIVIDAIVDASTLSGSVTNTASVTFAGDPIPANNTDGAFTQLLSADLSISKSDSADPVLAGSNLTYTVTVENLGPDPAQNVVVSDTLPAGVTFVSTSGCNNDPNGVGTCNLGTINSGATPSYTIEVTVNSDLVAGTITNTATVSADTADLVPGNNSISENTTVEVEADLAITKVVSGDFKAGQTATYLITVTNNGPSDASGVSVADTIPSPLTIDSVSSSQGACAALPCSLGDIAASGNATVTVVVNIPSDATGTVDNTASVSSSTTDSTPGNDSDTDSTAITVEADLTISKTASPTTMTAGSASEITYTLDVTNNGPADATLVTVEDVLPAGVTLVSATGPNGACSGAGTGGDPIVCDLGTVVDQATPSVTIKVTVGADTAAGTITNTGEVKSADDTVPGNNTDTADVTVDVEVALSITKTDNITTVIAGNQLTYEIVVSNAGPSAAVGTTVTDTFPADLTVGAWTCTPAGALSSCSNGSGDLNESVNIGPGGSVTFSVTATVDPGATGTISNTASVTKPSGTTETNTADNSATDADTIITQAADLAITKTAQNVVAGAQVSYTITASNPGPSDAVDATVADTFPGSLSTVSWTCLAGGNSSCAASGSGNINEMVTIAVGESVIFTAAGDLASSATGDLVNTATLTAPAGLTDSNLSNNSATDTTAIAQEAELVITKSDSVDPVVAGQDSTVYTVTVTNNGPSDAQNVVVTDTLPAGVTFVSTAGDCAEGAGGVPTCTLGTIADGASKQFTINVTVDSAASGTLTNNATVASDTALGGGSVTSVDEMTTVNTEAAINVTKDDAVTSLIPGNPTTYTIVVGNAGPSDLTGATVSDIFPAAITSTSTTSVAAGGATGSTAGPFASNISDTVTIPPSGSITYTVVAQTDPAATVSLANTVSVTGGADTVSGTTSATDTDTLSPSGDLSITKADDVDPISTGNVLTYSIVVSNSGPSTATGVTVVDNFPTEFTSPAWTCAATGAGSSCAAMGAGNLNQSVDIGPTGMVTFTVSGTISTAVAIQITNTATLTAPAGFTDTGGADSVMETTNLLVNVAPVASVTGSLTTGVVGESLTLMGSNSTDDGLPNPPATLTFDWTFTSVPAGSAVPTGSTFSTLADTTFTPDVVGSYMATLTADDSAASHQAMLTVTVSAASTTTLITADSPDPSDVNTAYTVSGTVVANAPSGATVGEGTVDVSDGTSGTCNSNVVAGAFSCDVTSTTIGAKTLTATYNVTTNFNGSNDTESHEVILPQVAFADAFDVIGNTNFELRDLADSFTLTQGLRFQGQLVSNDMGIVDNQTSVTAETKATTSGNVQIFADGSFIYTPSALCGPGETVTGDAFMYSLVPSGVMGTVTLTCVEQFWFVDNTAAGGGTGTMSSRFNTLGAGQTASSANDTVFVYQGTGNTGQNAGFTIKTGQRLIGQGVDLTTDTDFNNNGTTVSATQTIITATSKPTIGNSGGNGVTASSVNNITIAGLTISSPSGDGISAVNLLGTTAAGTASVFDNITITGAGSNGIQIDNATSTNSGNTGSPDILTVQNSTINSSTVSGILAVTDNAGTGNFRLDVTNSNFSANVATGIATNANGGNLQTNITGNTIVHGAGNQFRGVDGGATSTGNLFFTVTGNTITANNGGGGTGPAVIAYANTGTGNVNGTIGGAGALANTVTNNTAAGTSVAGVSLTNEGAGSSFVTLNNNTITVADGFGIIANVQGTNTGAGHFHVLGNTVSVSPGTNIANTAVSPRNLSSAGTECLNISANTVTTNPGTNFDIVLTHSTAAGAFQVQQTNVTTTDASLDGLANTQPVELHIQAAQTVGNDVAANPNGLGDYTPGTCTTPASP